MKFRNCCALLTGVVVLGGFGCRAKVDEVHKSTGSPEKEVVGQGFPAYFPVFSWDTVPVYQMFADTRLLTKEEVDEVASTSEFICIEKQHGIRSHGAADIGAKEEIRQFKAVNPDLRALVYYNSAYAYPFTSHSKGFHHKRINDPENAKFKSYLITDQKTGELTFREGDHTHHFDVLNPELRDWWTQTVGEFVRDAGGDGLFVDQMHGFSWLRAQKKDEVDRAQVEMMRMAKEAIGPDKILLLNNAAHIPALFEVGDGFMFEHYSAKLLTKEKIVDDWKLMKKISHAKKFCVWRIGIEHDKLSEEMKQGGRKLSQKEYESVSRKRISFYIAAFLMGAQEQSYLQYGWGWRLDTGTLCGYPELKKPLGKPKGEYTRTDPEGWEFRREFEHASVVVDLEKREGSIE
jgi:hypothetical protein